MTNIYRRRKHLRPTYKMDLSSELPNTSNATVTVSTIELKDDEKIVDVVETSLNNLKITQDTNQEIPMQQHKANDRTIGEQNEAHDQKDQSNENTEANIHDYISVVNPSGKMLEKWKAAAPYHFFLTTITESPSTHSEPLSITLLEILDRSLGEIESTVQINFMVDIDWLLNHYHFAGCVDKPLLVVHGDETPELKNISKKVPHVTAINIPMKKRTTHHTKIMLIGYKDGSMRVIVSTANLIENDWHNRVEGVWIGPKCEPLPENADTTIDDSPTGFRYDLVRYLLSYNLSKLRPWIERIKQTSFKDVNVFLVTSVPGEHRRSSIGYQFGHAKVSDILSKHCASVPDNTPLIAQSSSIGYLGPNVRSWIGMDIIDSFSRDCQRTNIRKLPPFKMVYPSLSNVKNSHDGLMGGAGLPYDEEIDKTQPWLINHLHQWKSSKRFRSQAMPHIKSYCRWTEEDGLFWFLLTSANLSRAAWGAFYNRPLIIKNFEAGVLFLPKFVMKNGGTTFPMQDSKNGFPAFPMPYDVPLTPYCKDDTPFLIEHWLREKKDDSVSIE